MCRSGSTTVEGPCNILCTFHCSFLPTLAELILNCYEYIGACMDEHGGLWGQASDSWPISVNNLGHARLAFLAGMGWFPAFVCAIVHTGDAQSCIQIGVVYWCSCAFTTSTSTSRARGSDSWPLPRRRPQTGTTTRDRSPSPGRRPGRSSQTSEPWVAPTDMRQNKDTRLLSNPNESECCFSCGRKTLKQSKIF